LHNILEATRGSIKQTNKPKQGDKDTKEATNLPQISKGTTELLKDKTNKTRDMMMMKGTFHQKDTSQQ
jgi:hypothetical protein